MRLHIIHLPYRKDRLEAIYRQLEEQGISDYVFWEGCLDKNPSIGIARAHQRIVNWAKDQNATAVTIAEDDLVFSAKGAMDYYTRNLPDNYDLYLGGITFGRIHMDHSVNDFAGTHLYTIHNRFFDTFLSLNGETDIDRAMAGRGRFVVCNPMIARQADGYSDNVQSFRTYQACWRDRDWWKA